MPVKQKKQILPISQEAIIPCKYRSAQIVRL